MRYLIVIFCLVFGFNLSSKADDIRDFQIEGISIGKSALDFYPEKKIKDNYQDWFEPKYGVSTIIESRGIYDEIQLMFERNDSNYKIVAISALKFSDPSYCLEKIDDVKIEIQNLFNKDIKASKRRTKKHPGDKTGKSKVTSYFFELKKTKDLIIVACYDWSKKMEYWDNLRISVRTKKYDNYISK